MKNQTLTIVLVLMAFVMGFFTKEIIQAVGNITNNIAPASCTLGTNTYKSGDVFRSEDGCNSCSCQNGEISCTMIACEDEAFTPPPQGKTIEPSPDIRPTDIISDPENGAIGGCFYNGMKYAEGASFIAADGCNSCGCSGGQINCTLRACAQ